MHPLTDEFQVAAALAAALHDDLERYQGQRFLGVVRGLDWIEIVFDKPYKGNLFTVSLNAEGHITKVNHGYVEAPEFYVKNAGVANERHDLTTDF